ncbi:a-type inclusion protein [Anaeramoeba flamelloides]|uniref:A-type inclusion protein n=1 Tax=Anaeramoeba flamelloides TaxID=1746091 RepID=A0AAV7YLT7_9EUKA|nr:a-type inclusion protein [Anaeramoeba flamelloides]
MTDPNNIISKLTEDLNQSLDFGHRLLELKRELEVLTKNQQMRIDSLENKLQKKEQKFQEKKDQFAKMHSVTEGKLKRAIKTKQFLERENEKLSDQYISLQEQSKGFSLISTENQTSQKEIKELKKDRENHIENYQKLSKQLHQTIKERDAFEQRNEELAEDSKEQEFIISKLQQQLDESKLIQQEYENQIKEMIEENEKTRTINQINRKKLLREKLESEELITISFQEQLKIKDKQILDTLSENKMLENKLQYFLRRQKSENTPSQIDGKFVVDTKKINVVKGNLFDEIKTAYMSDIGNPEENRRRTSIHTRPLTKKNLKIQNHKTSKQQFEEMEKQIKESTSSELSTNIVNDQNQKVNENENENVNLNLNSDEISDLDLEQSTLDLFEKGLGFSVPMDAIYFFFSIISNTTLYMENSDYMIPRNITISTKNMQDWYDHASTNLEFHRWNEFVSKKVDRFYYKRVIKPKKKEEKEKQKQLQIQKIERKNSNKNLKKNNQNATVQKIEKTSSIWNKLFGTNPNSTDNKKDDNPKMDNEITVQNQK